MNETPTRATVLSSALDVVRLWVERSTAAQGLAVTVTDTAALVSIVRMVKPSAMIVTVPTSDTAKPQQTSRRPAA